MVAELGTLKGLERALNSIIISWRYGDQLLPFYDALPDLIELSETLFDQLYPEIIMAVKDKPTRS